MVAPPSARGPVRLRVQRRISLQAPLGAYADALSGASGPCLLLDTATGTSGRSLLALETGSEIRAYRGAFAGRRHTVRTEIQRAFGAPDVSATDPLDAIAHELALVRETHGDSTDTSYACGYLAYEAAGFFHKLPTLGPHSAGEPADVAFAVVTTFLVEERGGTAYISALGTGDTEALAHEDALQRLDQQEARLQNLALADAGSPHRGAPSAAAKLPLPTADRPNYEASVQRCIEHIAAGDVFELCLTRELRVPYAGVPGRLYTAMRGANPAARGAYLALAGLTILCTSPELLLRSTAEGTLETGPIKGTRPRAAHPAKDAALREELANSAKDRAENVMIVDLARHELGQVAKVGSVCVPSLFRVESHALVHHLVSTVRAQLRPDQTVYDAIRAVFPAGSMTGAPKVQAIKTLSALENRSRGVYAGALGYISADGSCELAVVIRTVTLQDGTARLGTGGAVTADSVPQAEYDETCVKAAGLWALLGA